MPQQDMHTYVYKVIVQKRPKSNINLQIPISAFEYDKQVIIN